MTKSELIEIDNPECSQVFCNKETIPGVEPGEYKCRFCDTSQFLHTTEHIEDRWIKRAETPDPDVIKTDIRRAWDRGITLLENKDDDPRFGHRWDAEEVRYDQDSETVLLREDTGLITAVEVLTSRQNCKYSIVQTLYSTNQPKSMIQDAIESCQMGKGDVKRVIKADKQANSLENGELTEIQIQKQPAFSN